MLLRSGGIDIFYVDESHDWNVYVVTAVRVPFLRCLDGTWTIVWPFHLEAAQQWRKKIWTRLHIPTRVELHGKNLARGKGHLRYGKWNFRRSECVQIYREILSWIDFIPSDSIMSSACEKGNQLYGHEKLKGAMHGLFQRMRRQCDANDCNALVFFDEGHPEYRTLYRRAQV